MALKENVKQVVKVNRKTFFNPRAWLGYDAIKDQNRAIWNSVRGLFIAATPTRKETFEQAMVRLDLTEESLKESQTNFQVFTWIFTSLGVFSFVASFVILLKYASLAGFVLAIAVTALMLSQAFQYSFWLFQLKNRKLGCTFEEWWNRKVNDKQGPAA